MQARAHAAPSITRLVLPIFGLALAALSCSVFSSPKFVNHPNPSGALNFESFESLGCGDSSSNWECAPDSAIRDLGCHELAEPSALLAGLQPDYAIIACRVIPLWEAIDPYEKLEAFQTEGSFIYWEGGFIPIFYRYLILVEGEPVLLSTEQDFQDTFAPIETPEEALAYALALSSASPRFGLAYDGVLDYVVKQLEDTHVDEIDDGFEVNLYSYQFFGCGPHWTTEIVYQVGRDGTVETQSGGEVFKNSEEDNICVD